MCHVKAQYVPQQLQSGECSNVPNDTHAAVMIDIMLFAALMIERTALDAMSVGGALVMLECSGAE
jgi:hypothetical protein